jgi:hypothetical protein
MVVHIYNPSTWEAEEGGSSVQGQPGLYNNFKANVNKTLSPKTENRKTERERERGI